MPRFWNERYSAPEYVYGTQPNAFFRHCLDQLNPGTLLLPAEGEGRNAVYAASRGWSVDAFDFSSAAREKALALAAAQSVEIDYSVSDIESFDWQPETFDAVGLCFVHMPPPLRRFLHQQVIQSLKTGGHIILEAFSPDQLNYSSGGPRSLEMLYTLQEMQLDFSGLDILVAETLETDLQEGIFHAGKAAVVRIFAKKTAS